MAGRVPSSLFRVKFKICLTTIDVLPIAGINRELVSMASKESFGIEAFSAVRSPFAKGGKEVVIRDGNLPVAKLVPFPVEGAGCGRETASPQRCD
jgi:hypothetical protein